MDDHVVTRPKSDLKIDFGGLPEFPAEAVGELWELFGADAPEAWRTVYTYLHGSLQPVLRARRTAEFWFNKWRDATEGTDRL